MCEVRDARRKLRGSRAWRSSYRTIRLRMVRPNVRGVYEDLIPIAVGEAVKVPAKRVDYAHVDIRAAVEIVVADYAVHGDEKVPTGAAVYGAIVAVAAIHMVLAIIAEHIVSARSAVDLVIARVAMREVGAGTGFDIIVAGSAPKNVVAVQAVDFVGVRAAGDVVGFIGPNEGPRQSHRGDPKHQQARDPEHERYSSLHPYSFRYTEEQIILSLQLPY